MMILDSVSEKLRSKHVRTLEVLQKTLDENVELREQVAQLQKDLPRSQYVEDEIERMKEEHAGKLKEVEDAAMSKLGEQTGSMQILEAANNKLKNDMITMDVALRDAREKLQYERQTWKKERARLEAIGAQAQKTHPPASPTQVKQNDLQPEEATEDKKLIWILTEKLESSHHACTNAENARKVAETQTIGAQHELKRVSREVASQREQIVALQTQLTAAQVHYKSLSEELETMRECNRIMQTKLPTEQPSSSSKLLLHQKTLLAQVQDTEERYAKLEDDNRLLQSHVIRLQQQLANEIAQRKADAAEASIFANHVELKRENFQLRAQVEELKALQKRFLTSAKKKTMSLPSL